MGDARPTTQPCHELVSVGVGFFVCLPSDVKKAINSRLRIEAQSVKDPLKIDVTAAYSDCICPLITQIQWLFLICDILVDGFIDHGMYVDVLIRRTKLHH